MPQAVHLTYLHLDDAPKDMSGIYKCLQKLNCSKMLASGKDDASVN